MRPTQSPNFPRGIRNHNPGNIRHTPGTRWQVMAHHQTDPHFIQYTNPRWGIRAIARTLITYQDKRQAADGSPIDSVRDIIQRWAPPNENNTHAYIHNIARAIGLHPDDHLDVYHHTTMRNLVTHIIRHENGPGPLPGGHWYGQPLIDDALQLAGLEPGATHGHPASVNRATP